MADPPVATLDPPTVTPLSFSITVQRVYTQQLLLTDNFELREDGSYELREDGSYEQREGQ